MRGKITFFIKKEVEAESIAEAIEREPLAPIIEIYKSDDKQPSAADAIGFKLTRADD